MPVTDHSLQRGKLIILLAGRAGGIGIGVDATMPHVALAGRNTWSAAFTLTLRFRR